MSLFSYRVVGEDGLEVQGHLKAKDQVEARITLEKRGFSINGMMRIAETEGRGAHKKDDNAGSRGRNESGIRVTLRKDDNEGTHEDKKQNAMMIFEMLKKKLERLAPIPAEEIMLFFNQMEKMLSAGIHLVRGLDMMEEQADNERFKKIVGEMKRDIQEGATVCSAMNKHPEAFSEAMISVIKCGEKSGRMAEMMGKLAIMKEKEITLVRKIKQASIYPLFVFISILVFLVFFFKCVGDAIIPLLSGMLGELPLITRSFIFSYKIIFNPIFLLLFAGMLMAVPWFKKKIDESSQFKFLCDQ